MLAQPGVRYQRICVIVLVIDGESRRDCLSCGRQFLLVWAEGMKALIQRVSEASVSVEGQIVGDIGQGLLVLLGVERGDDIATTEKLCEKILNYRVFSDEKGKMNLSVHDVQGGVLLVSQFTLAADTQSGLRPSFSCAGSPDVARELYEYAADYLRSRAHRLSTGIFAADMKVRLTNDGPVTFMLQM